MSAFLSGTDGWKLLIKGLVTGSWQLLVKAKQIGLVDMSCHNIGNDGDVSWHESMNPVSILRN